MPPELPSSRAEKIAAIRAGFTCQVCGRYVGSLAESTYSPAPYAVASAQDGDEVEALVQFEWHMLGMLQDGAFRLVHPQKDGRCVSMQEWAESDDDAPEEDADPEPGSETGR